MNTKFFIFSLYPEYVCLGCLKKTELNWALNMEIFQQNMLQQPPVDRFQILEALNFENMPKNIDFLKILDQNTPLSKVPCRIILVKSWCSS